MYFVREIVCWGSLGIGTLAHGQILTDRSTLRISTTRGTVRQIDQFGWGRLTLESWFSQT